MRIDFAYAVCDYDVGRSLLTCVFWIGAEIFRIRVNLNSTTNSLLSSKVEVESAAMYKLLRAYLPLPGITVTSIISRIRIVQVVQSAITHNNLILPS